MIQRPPGIGAFQFVVIASLRAVQLRDGCRPRVDGVHKHTVMAQLEVSQGKVIQEPVPLPDVAGEAPAVREATGPAAPALLLV